jgi:ABC-type sugar transport system ATPase subunit
MTPVFELRKVSKHYGPVRALEDVDFRIWPDEVQAVVGDNGAGKSTLVKIISGAHRHDGGAIFGGDGEPVEIGSPERAAKLGVATVYQNLALVNSRSVAENVFLGREPVRRLMVDRRRLMRETEAALAALGVSNVASVEAEVGQLSGGQRQAVAITRAVLEGHRVLLLDEPTAALGVRESEHVLDLIAGLREKGVSIVLVSHNLHHVFRVSDRITVLRGGRVVGSCLRADTTPEQVVSMITGAHLMWHGD